MANIENLSKITDNIEYHPAVLHWNNVALIHQLDEVAKQVNQMIVTSETVPAVKKELTFIRNYIKSNEDKRKQIKAELIAPAKKLDEDTKTMLKSIRDALNRKNDEIKQLDDDEREERADHIRTTIIEPMCASRGISSDDVPVQHAWTNKSISNSKLNKEIAQAADLVAKKQEREGYQLAKRNGELIIVDENGEDTGIKPKQLTITYCGDDKNITDYIMNLSKNTSVLDIK